MAPDIKKVLVPVDFSDFSVSSLKYAVSFAASFNADIILVYVVEPVTYPPDFSIGQIPIPAMDIDLHKRADEEISSLISKYVPPSMKAKKVIRSGKPFYEIISLAKEEDVDLIIIATHGHSGVEHILFGSTAEKVVRKAPCAVLTLRDPIKGFNYKSPAPSAEENN
jgi:nucleotide-binding universal stress UspA family protein